MSMQWQENVDWSKHPLGGSMGSSVQAPPTPDEPERFDAQVQVFEEVGRMWATHRVRTYHLMEAMLRGVQSAVREQMSQPVRFAAQVVESKSGDGRVRVVPEKCPQCKRSWRYLDEEKSAAPDSFIIAACVSGHRWRFSAERLATFRPTDDVPLPEPTGEVDDGNGMVVKAHSGAGMQEVEIEGLSYYLRHCMNGELHVSHSWPPTETPMFWCDGQGRYQSKSVQPTE